MEKIAYVERINGGGGQGTKLEWASQVQDKFVSYPSLWHCVGIELWVKAMLPANTQLPLGMSESVSLYWECARVLQLGQSSWLSGAHFNLPTEVETPCT